MTGPVTEFPNIFCSVVERKSTVDTTGLVVVKVLIGILTRDFTVFLAVDGVVYKGINACGQAAAIVIQG